MNSYENFNFIDNQKVNKFSRQEPEQLRQIFDLDLLQISHKLINSLNISTLILIFLVTFLSIYSQSKWTNFYSAIAQVRNMNSNLIDFIARTEELYIGEFENLDFIKKTSSRDLIYLFKPQIKNEKNSLLKSLIGGLKDSNYQRGF